MRRKSFAGERAQEPLPFTDLPPPILVERTVRRRQAVEEEPPETPGRAVIPPPPRRRRVPSAAARTAGWSEVEGAARAVFSIWSGTTEMEWARRAWRAMGQANLTSYASPLEFHDVAVHFMALCALYGDFCALAWDADASPQWVEWAGALSLQDLRIGQLVGRDPELSEEAFGTELLVDALEFLVDEARPAVFEALRDGFESEGMLFISLWRTNPGETRTAAPSILDTSSSEWKQRTWDWIESGCPPRL